MCNVLISHFEYSCNLQVTKFEQLLRMKIIQCMCIQNHVISEVYSAFNLQFYHEVSV